MSNFSIENVGAFELGVAISALSDGALEAASVNPGSPTKPGWTGFCCGRIDDGSTNDGALEAATVDPRPASPRYNCGRIDDGMLEASVDPQPPRLPLTMQSFCKRIDDGALEAAAVNPGAPTKPGWTGFCCGRIDDDAN